ncbi:unnamed protein product [Phytomonas sp. Hart1]|nr:unnamed protein product [Phytomonas sp. Hart1]|eukprot:CCW66641.1 unnamed protein product [Phytomonas sp. isolate Hart1]
MPVRIPTIPISIPTPTMTIPHPGDSKVGINPKRFCVEARDKTLDSPTSTRSPSESSSEDSSSTSSTTSYEGTQGSSETNSRSVESASDVASEPTLFQLAKDEGLLNEDLPLLDDVEETTEPILPPRPPVIRNFPSDLEKGIERYKERLNRELNAIAIKDDNKTVSLGTSKVNYIDPRIICSWAKEQNVPINKIFSATLQKKFSWALDAQGFNF